IKGTKVSFESHPTDSWPQILITLSRSVYAKPMVERFSLRPSNNTVEAEILYTRALYTLSEAMSCSLVSEDILDNQIVGIPFSHERLQEEEIRELLYRAKFARKLGFIQRLFNIVLTLPENITADQAQRVDTLFRGITEGEC